jgi:hypothetical protein
MKKILSLLLLIIPAISFCQDSSRLKPSVTLQARDCEFIASFIQLETKFVDLDSVLISKFRITTSPTGTDNVVIPAVENRVWIDIYRRLSLSSVALRQNTFTRFETALTATAHTWLTSRITANQTDNQDQFSATRKYGRERLKKELIEQF